MKIQGVPKATFRRLLVDACCGCKIQYTGWPCGSCFPYSADDWRAVLAFRGDYDENIEGDKIKMAVDFIPNADGSREPDGSIGKHVYKRIPLTQIEERIRRLYKNLKEDGV